MLFEMKLIVKEDVSSRTTLSSSSFIYCKLSSHVHRKIIYAMKIHLKTTTTDKLTVE